MDSGEVFLYDRWLESAYKIKIVNIIHSSDQLEALKNPAIQETKSM